MKQEPINYNNPLGISKREWTRVLGAIRQSSLSEASNDLSRTRENIENALADASGLPLSKIHEMCEGDYRMDANEAVSLGFADSIL